MKDKVLGTILLILLSYFFIIYPVGLLLLKYNGIKTKGVINSHLSSGRGRYTTICNKYEFWYNGEKYEGNSQIPENPDVVGDSIDIVFLDFWPSFNRPVSYFEE